MTYKLHQTQHKVYPWVHKYQIYRIETDGDGKKRLTSDLPAESYKHNVGWR